MADKRKVVFSYGMSDDYQLIVTDAPKEAIEAWCVQYLTDQENGVNYEPFYTLKTRYYVRELVDSQYENDTETLRILGYDEAYDYSDYEPKSEEEQQSPKYVGNLNDVSLDDFLKFMERYKGKGKKLSVMGTSFFNVFDNGKYIILDEEELSDNLIFLELELSGGKSIKVPLVVDITPMKFFEKQKNEVWKLLLSYMRQFGIQVDAPTEPDQLTVEEVHEYILKVFEKAGVKFDV